MKKKARAGFSLMELLVVMAIIAVLAAVLLPAVVRAKKMSESVVDISNMKQLYEALIMYQSDENDAYPITYNLIRPYTGSDAIFASKLDTGRVPLKNGKWLADPFAYDCILDKTLRESNFKMSYGYLRNYYPPGSEGRFRTDVQKTNFGLFADPWAGDEVDDGVVTSRETLCGINFAAIVGSGVVGSVLRIQTDGSLFVYSDCNHPYFYGTPDCFFDPVK